MSTVTLSFIGTVNTVLWNNETVPSVNGNPPPFNAGPYRSVDNTGIYDQTIQWVGPVASIINGLSINTLTNINVPNYPISLSYNFSAESGSMNNCIASGPATATAFAVVYFLTKNIGLLPMETINTIPSSSCNALFVKGISDLNYTTTTIGVFNRFDTSSLIESMAVYPWLNTGSAPNPSINGFTLNLVITVKIDLICSEGGLVSGTCLSTCSEQEYQSLCFSAYNQYCLVETDTNNKLNVFGATGCYQFFSQYIQDTGPSAALDTALTQACSSITGVDSLINSSTTTQNVCACHLNSTIYTNLQNDLDKEFPGSQLVDVPAACLFPICVTSGLKSMSTTKVCPVPACINIASINNNGTVTGGSETINQNIPNCVNLARKGSADGNGNGNGTTEEKSWIEKHWIWLVIGIGLLVGLIIIILVVLAGEANKKKKTKIITTK